MILLYIVWALIQLAIPVLIVVGIIWLIKKLSNPRSAVSPVADESYVRAKVAAEIRAQEVLYKTASQKKVVEDMAATVEYFLTHPYSTEVSQEAFVAQSAVDIAEPPLTSTSSSTESGRIISQEEYVTPWKKMQVIDGAVILLYLGAFFVIASIGLYVAFGAGEKMKAILVILLAGLFYFSGVFLYRHSKRLRPAGQTFAAIGMATVPIAGAAVYYYAFRQHYGPMVWLLTSLTSLMLYSHALWLFRSPFISYMLVFSTISASLSTIPSLGLSQFYFIQAAGLTGLLSVLIARIMKGKIVASAYDASAQFLVPFCMAVSLVYTAKIGWFNLAFSLGIGTAYYVYLTFSESKYRYYYGFVAQLAAIATILTSTYGVRENISHVAWLSVIIASVYAMIWVVKAARGLHDSPYRHQIRTLLMVLPVLSLVFTLGSKHALWAPVVAMFCAGALVYAYDHDEKSGLLWLLSLLGLPTLLGLWALPERLDNSVIAAMYFGLALLSWCVRQLMVQKTELDTVFGQLLLACGLGINALFMLGEPNGFQLVFALAQVTLISLETRKSEQGSTWLNVSAITHAVWLLAFIDDKKLLLAFIAFGIVFNSLISRLQVATKVHDWFASVYILCLPALYGWYIASPTLSARAFLAMYAVLFALILVTRLTFRFIDSMALTALYYSSLCTAIASAFVSGNHRLVLLVVCVAALVHLVLEKIEKAPAFGYMAPLIPFTFLCMDGNTPGQIMLVLGVVTGLSFVITLLRKRSHEAYITVLTSLVMPIYAGYAYKNYTSFYVAATFCAVALLCIVVRFVLRGRAIALMYPLRTGYMVAITLATLYCSALEWRQTSLVLFACGLLLTCITYLESWPFVVTIALLYGYASLFKFTSGVGVAFVAEMAIFIALTQSIYWLLIASRLDTIRARYARDLQIVIAGILPLVGVVYPTRPVVAVSLFGFSVLLLREWWSKGQSYREYALFAMHSAVLWVLYACGVRELQVYTQSTALIVALFAWWRRKLQDQYHIINSYLWTAVLFFTVPMVFQAISSAKPAYAYLVLVEHTLLIVISILFRRAAFTWWSIAVIVASVLYQLRTYRYAALAFLGMFIISLAVYFLLRYNKPDNT